MGAALAAPIFICRNALQGKWRWFVKSAGVLLSIARSMFSRRPILATSAGGQIAGPLRHILIASRDVGNNDFQVFAVAGAAETCMRWLPAAHTSSAVGGDGTKSAIEIPRASINLKRRLSSLTGTAQRMPLIST